MGEILHHVNAVNNHYSHKAEEGGKYEFCYRNTLSDAPNSVLFYIYKEKARKEQNSHEDSLEDNQHTEDDNDRMVKEVEATLEAFEHIRDLQDSRYWRLLRHRQSKVTVLLMLAAESTYDRILWWTIVQLAIWGSVIYFQISYMTKMIRSRMPV